MSCQEIDKECTFSHPSCVQEESSIHNRDSFSIEFPNNDLLLDHHGTYFSNESPLQDISHDFSHSLRESLGASSTKPSHQKYNTRTQKKMESTMISCVGKGNTKKCTSFNDFYDDFVTYKSENGSMNVPTSRKGLGSQVKMVRARKKKYDAKGNKYKTKHSLTEEKIKLLDEQGFRWTIYNSFDERVKELGEYYKLYGKEQRPKKETSLGAWVKRQQNLYNKKELSKEREQSMRAVGFTFREKNK